MHIIKSILRIIFYYYIPVIAIATVLNMLHLITFNKEFLGLIQVSIIIYGIVREVKRYKFEKNEEIKDREGLLNQIESTQSIDDIKAILKKIVNDIY